MSGRVQTLLAEALAVAEGHGKAALQLECSAPRCGLRRSYPGLTLPQASLQARREGWRSYGGRDLCPVHAGPAQATLFAGGSGR